VEAPGAADALPDDGDVWVDMKTAVEELANVDVSIRHHLLDIMLSSFACRPGYVALDSSLLYLTVLDEKYVQEFVKTVTEALNKNALVLLPVIDFNHTCGLLLGIVGGKVKGRHWDTYPSAVTNVAVSH
jgi:hypothetical protein